MNRIKSLLAICLIPLSVSAIDISGSLQTDNCVFTKSDAPLSWQEYRLAVKGEQRSSETSRFFAETWVRALGTPDIGDNINIDIREAYYEIYGLLGNHLDLKIGRQRIAFGSADRLNPTDNINPDDLEDLYDFGRHLGSDGLTATGYIGGIKLTGIFIPSFRKASQPLGEASKAFIPENKPLNAPLYLDTITTHETLPVSTIADQASAALKAASTFAGIDLSLSYYYGRDDIPLLKQTVTPGMPDINGVPITVDIELVYPRMQIVGFDAAGEFKSIGLWAEAGLFIPEKIESSTSIYLDDKPYVKWVAGADYTFPANIYLNMQWAHGFVNERGEELNDLLLANVDWTTLGDKLKISPLGIGLEIKSFDNFSDNYAIVGQPSVTWFPVDNAEISAGARIIDGKAGTKFGALKESDQIFIKTKYSF